MLSVFFRLLSIFLMIAIGWAARRREIIGAETTRSLSKLLTYFFYPALIFTSISRHFNVASLMTNWKLPAGAFLIMLLGFAIGLLVERLVTDPHSPQGHTFLFQCTINNYSFLPMPLVLMMWGEPGVAGLIFSAMGPELAIWTLGIYALSGRKLSLHSFRQLINPPLITMIATLCFILLRGQLLTESSAFTAYPAMVELYASVTSSLTLLGGATIPLAMMVAGSRMAGLQPHHLFSRVQLALSLLRLVIIPAAAIGLMSLLPLTDDIRKILTMVAIMPVAVTSVVLCELYRSDSDFAASSVLITHLLCLLTVPLWLFLLGL